MGLTNQDFEKILNVGISLSMDQNPNHILETILNSGMQITGCDAGTLYLYENGSLTFRIMKTKSMGICKGAEGETIQDMPPVSMQEENVCAYAAIHNEVVNIPNVYCSERFDFSGPRRYDELTGYHTVSMLVIPVANIDGELIGVLQMINAMDKEGNVIPFDSQFEIIIRSLGALAAVELTNLEYVEEIKMQMNSFVEAMATAIDERTPYNGTHTRKVAGYVRKLAEYINDKYQKGEHESCFTENDLEQLKLAALSHDIGKMIVPLSVMNRATRLDGGLEIIRQRFELFQAWYEIDFLKGRISKETFEQAVQELKEALEFIERVDGAGFLQDADYEKVQILSKKYLKKENREKIYYITEKERQNLSIRKGTLNDEERAQMESHVEMTAKILGKVHFNKNYKKILPWAANHHELLDGSGYPNHRKGTEIDMETRMITIADIYDALTSADRPYKKPMPKEKAFKILKGMAAEGKLDTGLVALFEEALQEERK